MFYGEGELAKDNKRKRVKYRIENRNKNRNREMGKDIKQTIKNLKQTKDFEIKMQLIVLAEHLASKKK